MKQVRLNFLLQLNLIFFFFWRGGEEKEEASYRESGWEEKGWKRVRREIDGGLDHLAYLFFFYFNYFLFLFYIILIYNVADLQQWLGAISYFLTSRTMMLLFFCGPQVIA